MFMLSRGNAGEGRSFNPVIAGGAQRSLSPPETRRGCGSDASKQKEEPAGRRARERVWCRKARLGITPASQQNRNLREQGLVGEGYVVGA
ncbi:hypothetical protein E2C01_028498 [Portunus trituberculatus]|uniref:Uncharacterized protein n=1 Tax=Portunus trituberculatus TaxID=210409 RepID=A0A5B7ERU6_PORTR|nr:hypothetical protein [Portunus trituberculatus]